MNMRHSLLLLAATAAPIYAQQPPPPANASQPAIAAPAPVPQGQTLAEQRSAKLPALSLMPTDVDTFITTGDLTAVIHRFMKAPMPPHLHMALGSTGNSSVFLAAMGATSLSLNMEATDEKYAIEVLAQALSQFKDNKIDPVYAVSITGDASMDGLLESGLRALQDAPDTSGFCAAASFDGFQGVKIDLKEMMQSERISSRINAAELPQETEAKLRTLDGRFAYLLTKKVGEAQVLVLAEDPSAIKLPASPAESLLATDRLQAVDGLPGGIALFSYMSPKLQEKLLQLSQKGKEDMLNEHVIPMLTPNPHVAADQDDALNKAMEGLNTLQRVYSSMTLQTVTKPATLMVWLSEKDLHMELRTDAGNVRFLPGTFRLGGIAQQEDSALTVESSGAMIEGMPAIGEILTACEQVATGLSMGSHSSPDLRQQLAIYQMFKPYLMQMGEGVCSMSQGLGDSAGLVVKFQPDRQASASAALYVPISDKGALIRGWNQVLTSANSLVMATMGGNADLLSMIPLTEQETPHGCCYTLALPSNTEASLPQLLVTDQALIVSSSPLAASALAACPSAGESFAGIKLTFNTLPAAQIARVEADKARAKRTLNTASAQVDAEDDADESVEDADGMSGDDDDMDEDLEADVDFDDEDFSFEDKDLRDKEEIADTLEFFSEFVETIEVKLFQEPGENVLRTNIIMRR